MIQTRLLVANTLSLIAAFFMCLAAMTGKRRRVYLYQFADCAFLMLAQLFFGYPASAAVLAVGAVRNLLVSFAKYSRRLMVVFTVLTVSLSALSGGLFSVSVLALAATLVMTAAPVYARGLLSTKLFLLTTQLLWVIYSLVIFDFATAVSNGIAAVFAFASVIKLALNLHRAEN